MAGFQAVQLGMTYGEVVSILGPPSRTVTETVGGVLPSAIYAWDIPSRLLLGQATIWVVMEHGRVAKKTQDGLR
jgi:hypothetical protein